MRRSDHMNSFSGVLPIVFLLMADLAASQSNPSSPNQPSGPYNYGKLSPAMLIIVAILIIALFVMGFFSIYLRRNPDVSPTTGVRSRSTVPAAARGLDASVVETFPTFLYSDVKSQKLGKGELECAICLNEFEDDETLRLIPKCDHVFHPHCIGAWLEAHVTCPVCRANLSQQDIELKEETVNPEPVVNDLVSDQLATSEMDSRRLPGVSMDLKRIEFSRSHTTGHSVIQPGESTERFTLRLPEDVRERIMKDWKLNRTNGNSRARSDRWLFRKTPSFMWRSRDNGSIRLGSTSSVRANASNGGDRWGFLRNASFLVRNGSVHVSRGVNKDSEGVRSVSTSGGSVRLPV